MPTFANAPAGADRRVGPGDVPRDSYDRYLIPRYPLDGPLKHDDAPIEGTGMQQPWTRVSTVAKVQSDGYGIGKWQRRNVVKGMGLRPDLIALGHATPMSDTKTLDSIAAQAEDAASARASANLGTALHAYFERLLNGETVEQIAPPEPYGRDVRAFEAALKAHGIEPIRDEHGVWAERRVVIPAVFDVSPSGSRQISMADGNAAGLAGTPDLIVMYDGQPTIADSKTGRDPMAYGSGEIENQEFCYSQAWAWWDGQFFRPMPENLRTDYGLVLHTAAGTGETEIYKVFFQSTARTLERAMAIRAWRGRAKRNHVKLGEVPVVLESGVPDGDPPAERVYVTAVLDRSELTPGPGAEINLVPAKRVCSVCRQPGHRKGSPKCPGPGVPGSVAAATAEPVKTCFHTSGWSQDAETKRWYCPDCGQEGEAPNGPTMGTEEALAVAKAADAEPIPSTDPDYGDDGDVTEDAEQQPVADPFDDPRTGTKPAQHDYRARIEVATSTEALREVRNDAKAAGELTNDLLTVLVEKLDKVR